MVNATGQSFQREVLDASREVPVLVDFWAPWCGPCRALGPMLERLEQDAGGRFRLVKINSDENPELAAQFNVRSIPMVVAFVDGQPVDAFVGVLPERELRAFVERVAPDPAELERRKAAALLAQGDRDGALLALRAALALDPGKDEARLDLVALLLEGDAAAAAEAAELLARVNPLTRQSPRHRALTTLAESRAQVPATGAGELHARIAADPTDLAARADLARHLIGARDYEAALEQLLAIVERDRTFRDDYGRKAMLGVFDLLGDRPDVVSGYRRRLASALNR